MKNQETFTKEFNELEYINQLEAPTLKDFIDDDGDLYDDDLRDFLNERICEYEVIYYNVAMNILMEEDASLNESMGLASDNGYSLDDINSELLATLIIQDRMNGEIDEVIELINN